MSTPDLQGILALPDGPERTAGVAAWFQALYESCGQSPPVLVGGAAVELYSGGAYTTGDLDFVGEGPGPGVERELERAGSVRRGRHLVHEPAEIFIELHATTLGEGERVEELHVGPHRLRVIAPEALVVDRLAAWQHWASGVDGVAALVLYRSLAGELDGEALRNLATRRQIGTAIERLERFVTALGDRQADPAELEAWSRETPR